MNGRTVFSSVKKSDLKKLKKDISFLNALTKKNLSVFVVSPLVNFSFEKVYLQKSSSLLKDKLSKKGKHCDVFIETMKETKYPALMVRILTEDSIKYESIFLTLSDDYEERSVHHLPLLCVLKESGPTLTSLIHSTLEKMFNCNIKACFISCSKFLWLMGIAINESIMRKMNEGLNITFSLPNFTRAAAIEVHLTEQSLENLWIASRQEPTSNILSYEEIQSFYQGLLTHLKCTYGLNFEECFLKRVTLKGMKLNSGKKLQMFLSSDEIVYLILTYLLSDCLVYYINPLYI